MPRTTRHPSIIATTLALTPEAVRSAIYLDFEGFTTRSPALLGVLVDGSFESIVLDPVLRPAADAKGLRTAHGTAALHGIIKRARLEDRLICAFGKREREAALEDFGVDLGERFLNVQPILKKWWKRHRSERPKRRRGQQAYRTGGYSLEFFEEGLGLERPRHLKSGNATKRLRGVRDALLKHDGDWSRLTRTAKAKWTKLLDYNEVDVRNLAGVAQRVVATV